MNIFQTLRSDHGTVLRMADELARENVGASERERRLGMLALEMRAHARAEETFFYPLLADQGVDRDLIRLAFAEHHAVDLLLDDLRALAPDDGNWVARMRVLRDLIRAHFEREEDAIFASAREHLARERLDEMAETFERLAGEVRASA